MNIIKLYADSKLSNQRDSNSTSLRRRIGNAINPNVCSDFSCPGLRYTHTQTWYKLTVSSNVVKIKEGLITVSNVFILNIFSKMTVQLIF